jgi:hypothetical protein
LFTTAWITYCFRIAVYGDALTAANHPESRAIFYTDFSKKKIGSFLALLKGFEKSLQVLDAFFDDGIENSELLRKLTRCKESDEKGKFPDFKSKLEYFKVIQYISFLEALTNIINCCNRKPLILKML